MMKGKKLSSTLRLFETERETDENGNFIHFTFCAVFTLNSEPCRKKI